MKKITTLIALIGLALWFLSVNVYADIAIIAPFSNENCDQFFDNQALLLNPSWNDKNRTGLITLTVNFVAKKMAKISETSSFRKIQADYQENNNLNCFPVPKVITANAKPYQRGDTFTILRRADTPMPPRFIKVQNPAMCCYVSYPPERQPITL